MTVAAILKHKGTEVISVAPDVTVAELTRMLSARRIGALPVLDGSGQLLGIISERDVVHALAVHGAHTLELTAAKLMTPTPRTVVRRTTVAEAMSIMTEGRFRHLPVMEDGMLIGMVSIGDVVKARIMQQENEVDSLKAYVSSAA
jgi:CBS domain-containing protein